MSTSNTMTYKGYTAKMEFDVEDKIIVGRVLAIDDIITFHGASVAQFEAEFHAAVSANPYVSFWLRVPGSGQLVVRWVADGGISHEMKHDLRATAQAT